MSFVQGMGSRGWRAFAVRRGFPVHRDRLLAGPSGQHGERLGILLCHRSGACCTVDTCIASGHACRRRKSAPSGRAASAPEEHSLLPPKHSGEPPSSLTIRAGYELRANGLRDSFVDPWFDASNYGCTLVATPARGTVIGTPGCRGDLADDLIAQLVHEELTAALFGSSAELRDEACPSGSSVVEAVTVLPGSLADVPPPPEPGASHSSESRWTRVWSWPPRA